MQHMYRLMVVTGFWKYNGAASGTRGEGKRLEAIRIQLTGRAAQYYDVYYRVHAQTYRAQ